MKKQLLLLFLLPTFLVSCNSSWHNIDVKQANEIADRIIEHNKHNRPIHAIKKSEQCVISPGKTEKIEIVITKNYAAYNLNQYCFETMDLQFRNSTRPLFTKSTIYRVENSNVVAWNFNNMKINGVNVYAAKNNEAAKKLFETILDEQFNLYIELDSSINDPIKYHNAGIVSHNPLIDGSSEISAKNNDSLNIKSNYHSTKYAEKDFTKFTYISNDSLMLIENYRCLEYECCIKEGNQTGEKINTISSTTYDYDTPVHFSDFSPTELADIHLN